MKRFYALGCSFTNYAWPTWADMLGTYYDVYENWAYPGLGNRAITERLAELHARENLTKNDTVIIQWTSHLRHDWHANDTRHDTHVGVGWKTSGSIFNYINANLYDDKWIKTFWDENSYVMHTFNNIILAQNLLNAVGCNWRMTSMGYINKMNSDYPDSDHGEKTDNVDVWKDVPGLLLYKKIFDDKSKWLKPVGSYAWNNKTNDHYKFKADNGFSFVFDRHPSVDQHADYLKNEVLLSLNKSQELSTQVKNWIDTCKQCYKESHKDFDVFVESVDKNIVEWKNDYRGF